MPRFPAFAYEAASIPMIDSPPLARNPKRMTKKNTTPLASAASETTTKETLRISSSGLVVIWWNMSIGVATR